MIPTLPSSISDQEQIEFYSSIAGNLSDQSSIHVHWHTHRQNPSVCWICDMNILISKILLLTKSSLDIETRYSSDEESDTEIENDDSLIESLNYDEEPVPEYETVPEQSDEVRDK